MVKLASTNMNAADRTLELLSSATPVSQMILNLLARSERSAKALLR